MMVPWGALLLWKWCGDVYFSRNFTAQVGAWREGFAYPDWGTHAAKRRLPFQANQGSLPSCGTVIDHVHRAWARHTTSPDHVYHLCLPRSATLLPRRWIGTTGFPTLNQVCP